MTDDQLRADRDRLVESLFALRGRLVVTGRDERLPESVRHLLTCLLHGHGIERATVALAATSAGDSIEGVTWGKPVVFRDEQETND